MSIARQFVVLGILVITFGVVGQGWLYLLVWPGINFLVLGVAYARNTPRLFGKRPDGTLPFWSWSLLFPLLLYTSTIWHLVRLLSKEPKQNRVAENLVTGRRLLAFEIEEPFDNYVDLTAEFTEPAPIRRSPSYVSFPILDGAAPSPQALAAVIARLKPGRTFVHCAQGHGRTGLFALALLLNSGTVRSVAEGLALLKSARPGIGLKPSQLKCVEACAQRFLTDSEELSTEPQTD